MILKREYLSQSNSWLFQDAVKFRKNELEFSSRKIGENSYKICLFLHPKFDGPKFKVQIDYNLAEDKVSAHHCYHCPKTDCTHYFSAVDYCYRYITPDDLLESDKVANVEYEINIFHKFETLSAQKAIYIENLLQHNTPLRVYLAGYPALNLSEISKERELFSDQDLALLRFLSKNRTFTNRKLKYFTIPTEKIPSLLFILKGFALGEVKLKENQKNLIFSRQKVRFAIKISQKRNMSICSEFNTYNYFVGDTLYFCSANHIYSTNLPFSRAKIKSFLQGDYYLNDIELVFLQLLAKDKIEKAGHSLHVECAVPEYLQAMPNLRLEFSHPPGKVTMIAKIVFDAEHTLPVDTIADSFSLSVQNFGDDEKWCYLPPDFVQEVRDYFDKIGKPLAEFSEFTGYEVELIKDKIYQIVNPAWQIEVSRELQELLTQRVELLPEFDIRSLQQKNLLGLDINFSFERISIPYETLKKMQREKKNCYQVNKEKKIIISESSFAKIKQIDEILSSSAHKAQDLWTLPNYKLMQIKALDDSQTTIDNQYLKQMVKDLLLRHKKDIPPSPAQKQLRSYQRKGFEWLKTLESYHLNGILADEMGTGKTLQALSVLAMMPKGKNSLVICPKTLIYNWIAEAKKFDIETEIIDYQGSKEVRKKMLQTKNKIFVTSYAVALKDFELLKEENFYYLILDEAQNIKNPRSSRSMMSKALSAEHKIAISGTPIENSLQDLWSIFDFLLPGYLPNYRSFSKTVESKAKDKYLQKIISPFVLRRKKIDILQELAPKESQVIYCKMSKKQHNFYFSLWEQISKSILNDKNLTPIHILSGLTKLRQIANGLNLIDEKETDVSGKIEVAIDLINLCVENGKKILVFAQFLKSLKNIEEHLQNEKMDYSYMDGSTKNREKVIKEFNENPDKKVFLLSLKVGGLGLNLTAADTVILVDPWWNPMVENQAIDRTHRIGQTKKINIYKLITKNSIEEKILDLQNRKKELFDRTIEGVDNTLKKLNIQELKALFE